MIICYKVKRWNAHKINTTGQSLDLLKTVDLHVVVVGRYYEMMKANLQNMVLDAHQVYESFDEHMRHYAILYANEAHTIPQIRLLRALKEDTCSLYGIPVHEFEEFHTSYVKMWEMQEAIGDDWFTRPSYLH